MSEHSGRLVDEAIRLANEGDLEGAQGLAAEVLRREPDNSEARQIVEAGEAPAGELRRLVIVFADVVGSTELSARLDPEDYTRRLSRYHRMVRRILQRHGAGVVRVIGDGTLAVFGHPDPHEDDAARAIRASLELVESVCDSDTDGLDVIHTRAAVHFGLMHLSLADGDVFGLAPNVASRLQGVAEPDEVVISEDVLPLIGDLFEVEHRVPRAVKGIEEPLAHYRVLRARPVDSRRGRRWETPFVGRADEQAALDEWLRSDVVAALVHGEPGVGKSRLVDRVLSGRAHPEERTLVAYCTLQDSADGFSSLRDLLRLESVSSAGPTAAETLEMLERDLYLLGLDRDSHLGPLALALGIPGEAGYDRPETDLAKLNERIVQSLEAWVAALCDRGHTLVVVEDLQWADASSLSVLERLCGWQRDNLKLLMTSREDVFEGEDLVRVPVVPLSDEEAAELTEAVGGQLSDERRDEVVLRGVGIPLLIEELARWDGTPPPEDKMPASSHDSVVPDALYGPLVTKLYSEGVDVNLAQMAATIGEEFETEVLAGVSHRTTETFKSGLSTLVGAGIVHEVGDGSRHSFRHALVRDVAYEVQPSEVRRNRHASVAEALKSQRERGAAVSSGLIAGHFRRAQRYPEAIEAYEAGAQESMQRGQLEEGRGMLDTALDLLASLGNGDRGLEHQQREVELRLLRGFITVSAGGNADPRAGDDYEACRALAPALTSTDDYIGMLGALWGYYLAAGDLDTSTDLIDTILDTPGNDDPGMRADNLTAKGMTDFFMGEFGAADAGLQAVRQYVPEGVQEERALSRWQFPNDPVGTGHVMYALTRWQRGDVAGFRDGCDDARRRIDTLGFPHGPFTWAFCLTHQAWVATELDQFDRAGKIADELVAVSSEHGFDYWLLLGLAAAGINSARRELADDDPDSSLLQSAVDSIGESITVQRMVGAIELLPYFVSALGDVVAAAGDGEAGLAHLDEAVELADQTGSRFYLAETHRVRARVLRELGRKGWIDELWRARHLAHEQGSVPHEYRALADLAAAAEDIGDLLRRMPDGAAAAAGIAPLEHPAG